MFELKPKDLPETYLKAEKRFINALRDNPQFQKQALEYTKAVELLISEMQLNDYREQQARWNDYVMFKNTLNKLKAVINSYDKVARIDIELLKTIRNDKLKPA